MIKGIIFDLDMCILDTHSLTGPYFQPVLDALHNSDLSAELKEKVEHQLWTTSLEDTAKVFAIPESVLEKMREAYRHIEVPEGIRSFGDEECLRDLPVKKYLVTTGYIKFQGAKIDQLGIRDLFDEIIIDELDDMTKRKGKRRIFGDILKENEWEAKEVLAIGDNPLSELGAAQSLGIIAVQTLRPTVEKWDEAEYHIHSFSELAPLMQKIP